MVLTLYHEMEKWQGLHGEPNRIRFRKGTFRSRYIQGKRDTKDSATTKINIHGMVTIFIG